MSDAKSARDIVKKGPSQHFTDIFSHYKCLKSWYFWYFNNGRHGISYKFHLLWLLIEQIDWFSHLYEIIAVTFTDADAHIVVLTLYMKCFLWMLKVHFIIYWPLIHDRVFINFYHREPQLKPQEHWPVYDSYSNSLMPYYCQFLSVNSVSVIHKQSRKKQSRNRNGQLHQFLFV